MSSVTPARFFEEELPRLFAQGSARTKKRASVIFEIAGESGGRWRLTLGHPPRVEPVPPLEGAADLLIQMPTSMFPAFLDGSIDVERAVTDGQLLLAGDLSLVDELAAMWSTPKSWLDVRVEGSKR